MKNSIDSKHRTANVVFHVGCWLVVVAATSLFFPDRVARVNSTIAQWFDYLGAARFLLLSPLALLLLLLDDARLPRDYRRRQRMVVIGPHDREDLARTA